MRISDWSSDVCSSDLYGWGGPGDGSRSRDEMRALAVLELEPDADFTEVRTAYRRLAKANHPDTNPNDAEAAARFQAVQAAYDVLRIAEENREWRSEKRRVGKRCVRTCRSRGSPYSTKKKIA